MSFKLFSKESGFPGLYTHAATSFGGYIYVVGGRTKLPHRHAYGRFGGFTQDSSCDMHVDNATVYRSKNGVKWQIESVSPENGLVPRAYPTLYEDQGKLWVAGGHFQKGCGSNHEWEKPLQQQYRDNATGKWIPSERVWNHINDAEKRNRKNIDDYDKLDMATKNSAVYYPAVCKIRGNQRSNKIDTLLSFRESDQLECLNDDGDWDTSLGVLPHRAGNQGALVNIGKILFEVTPAIVHFFELPIRIGGDRVWGNASSPYKKSYFDKKRRWYYPKKANVYNIFVFDDRIWMLNGSPKDKFYGYWFTKKLRIQDFADYCYENLPEVELGWKPITHSKMPLGTKKPDSTNYARRDSAAVVNHGNSVFIIGGWLHDKDSLHESNSALNDVWRLKKRKRGYELRKIYPPSANPPVILFRY